MIYQQSKKLNEYIFLAPNADYNFIVIMTSPDIFRNGIKIFIDDKEVMLAAAGS
jgi:hypothetical protein